MSNVTLLFRTAHGGTRQTNERHLGPIVREQLLSVLQALQRDHTNSKLACAVTVRA